MTLRVGLVGCGAIASTYLGLAGRFPGLRFTACADLRPAAADALASAHGLRALPLPALLALEDVDAVLNLTVPNAHAEVTLAAIAAGKHVYSEKPLATRLDDGRRILQAAAAQGVRVGCAPDTVLGAGVQTARRLLDEGAIGTPLLGHAAALSHGMEHFHPNPDFFYQAGGGPVFDRAPYELAALVTLLGPVASVQALGCIGAARRTITAPASPRRGEAIDVHVLTSVQALLQFDSGAQVSLQSSWDVWRSELPALELHGSEGSMQCPDPNWFGGDVRLCRRGAPWQTHATDASPAGRPNLTRQSGAAAANYRGLGLAEMAQAIAQQRPHRASGAFALHLLAVMEAMTQSATQRRPIDIAEHCARPEALTDAQAQTLLQAA